MKIVKPNTLYLFVSSLVYIFAFLGCKPNEPIVFRSSDNTMISFKLSGLSPEVVGLIDLNTRKITVTVPHGTVLTALIPSLEIPAKATSLPATGVAQDFTNPVIYSVTAEDGSTQNYTVTVTANFTLYDYHSGFPDIEQFGYFLLNGDNFGTDASKAKVEFINKTTSAITSIASFVVFNNSTIGLTIPGDLPLGQYNIKLSINSQQKTMLETFTLTVASPQIIDVSKLTAIDGETLTITGIRFQYSGNVVKLSIGGGYYNQRVISESTTSITVYVFGSVGSHILQVTSNGKTKSYSEKINIITNPNTPVITSLNKTTFTRGETITITGMKLSKAGFSTNLILLPFPTGGLALVRSCIANAEGTQLTYTIPTDFPAGTYTISIGVDLLFSDTYVDAIKINP
jgi:hypothetical protein